MPSICQAYAKHMPSICQAILRSSQCRPPWWFLTWPWERTEKFFGLWTAVHVTGMWHVNPRDWHELWHVNPCESMWIHVNLTWKYMESMWIYVNPRQIHSSGPPVLEPIRALPLSILCCLPVRRSYFSVLWVLCAFSLGIKGLATIRNNWNILK